MYFTLHTEIPRRLLRGASIKTLQELQRRCKSYMDFETVMEKGLTAFEKAGVRFALFGREEIMPGYEVIGGRGRMGFDGGRR